MEKGEQKDIRNEGRKTGRQQQQVMNRIKAKMINEKLTRGTGKLKRKYTMKRR
jgi:hypothetical protein